jgi:hypothetical protein
VKRGCLTALAFVATTIIAWIGLALYVFAQDPRAAGDSGGYSMWAGVFLITWGVAIAVGIGALAALSAWAATWPPEE